MFRKSLKTLGAAALALAAVTVSATPAAAHHANVTASANCAGVVSFTAISWEGIGAPGSAEWVNSRTNPTVEVAWGTAGASGAFTVLPAQPTYRFAADNNYTFSDGFTPSPALAPGTVVTVRVSTPGTWGTGVVELAPRYADATIPAPCTAPTVAVTCPASVVYGTAATYTATPTGTGPFTYQWSVNGAPVAGATGNTASITRGAPTDAVSVTVTDANGQSATASAQCSATYAAPTVAIACPHGLQYGQASAWTAVVTTGAGNPVTYQWSVNGTPVAGATAATASLTVGSAADTVSVTVTDAQTPALTATASASCMAAAPPTTPAPTISVAASTPEPTPSAPTSSATTTPAAITPAAITPAATTPEPTTPAATTPAATATVPAASTPAASDEATPEATPSPEVLGESEIAEQADDTGGGTTVEGVKVSQADIAAQTGGVALPMTGRTVSAQMLVALALILLGAGLVLTPKLLGRLR